jgi:hypothetical protein
MDYSCVKPVRKCKEKGLFIVGLASTPHADASFTGRLLEINLAALSSFPECRKVIQH